jgi:hypothetical protein
VDAELHPIIEHQDAGDDDVLMSFANFVQDLADHSLQVADPISGQSLTVDEMKLNLPIEIRVEVDAAGIITLKGSPPTQRTETTILPVFHQMQLRIAQNDGDEE